MDNDPFNPARRARQEQDKVFAKQRQEAVDDFDRRQRAGAIGRGGVLGFLIVVGLILLGAWLLFRS